VWSCGAGRATVDGGWGGGGGAAGGGWGGGGGGAERAVRESSSRPNLKYKIDELKWLLV